MNNHLAIHFSIAIVTLGLTCIFYPQFFCKLTPPAHTDRLMIAYKAFGLIVVPLGLLMLVIFALS